VQWVTATSKHVLIVLARAGWSSPVARRIGAAVAAGAILAALPALPGARSAQVQIHAAPVAGGGWLDRFNLWRATAGVPTLTENATWSDGDYKHSLYMVKDDQVTHYEIPGYNYYTPEGDAAARNSDIQVSSDTSRSDEQAIDWWMQAPFHSMNMMDPRLQQTGYGAYREVKSGWQAGFTLDVLRGNTFSGGSYPVYWPGNGVSEPLTSYTGGEYPDPLQGCPGYGVPSGLPVYIQVGGNVQTVAGPSHSFTGNGVALEHCVIDSTNSAVGSNLYTRGGVIVIPRQPLQSGVKYVVSLTVNGTPYTWSFTVGPFTMCQSLSASSTPAAQAAVGTAVSMTASAAGCLDSSPQYEFWLRYPGTSCCQLAQAYSTNPTFNWATTGLAPGAYTIAVWTRDAKSAGAFSNSFGRYDAYTIFQYTLSSTAPTPCSSVAGSSTPPSTTGIGIPVTITGSASGCPNPLYAFFMLTPGSSTWQPAQAYSSSATFHWNTSGQTAGVYHFSVWARDTSSVGSSGNVLGRWDAYTSIAYTLTVPTPCTSSIASAAPPSTATAGTAVTITGAASGCPNPNYQFFMLTPGSSTWQLVQAYSAAAAFHWNTTGLSAGVYRFSVWARDASSLGTAGNTLGRWDAYTALQYSLTLPPPCGSVTASASPPSTAARGTPVTITGAAQGCSNALYQFWMLAPGSSTWVLAKPYSSSASFQWATTGQTAGVYHIQVWARDASSSGTSGDAAGRWDAYIATAYTLT
jgi:hypothetical protein